MRPAIVLAVLLCLLGGCGGGDRAARTSSTPAEPSIFEYDRSVPLGFRDRGVVNRRYPVQVHDVSYASPRGGRVSAYLVIPPGEGPFSAVVYLHGAGGSRVDFLAPATWLGGRRAVALTIDSAFARAGVSRLPLGLAGIRRQRDLEVQTIVDLRRAVDLLRSLDYVARDRIGFVGLSAGARSGAILAGLEHRIKAFVLMSGGATSPRAYAAAAPAALRPQVLSLLRQTDPLRHVRRSTPSRLFFQLGRTDEIVPRAALTGLYRAAGQPKQVRWYAAGHLLNARAYRDQLRWLASELRLTGPPVPGALSDPPPDR